MHLVLWTINRLQIWQIRTHFVRCGKPWVLCSGEERLSAGLALHSWRPCRWRGHRQRAGVPEAPGHQGGAENPTWALSVLTGLNTSEGLRQNLLLNFPNVWLLHSDPQRGAELQRYPWFLPKCVCLCVRAHACVWMCIYMSFSFKHLSAPEQRLQRLPPAAALTWHWPSNKQRYNLLLGPALVWEREMKRGLIWPIVWMGLLSQNAQILLGLWCLCWHKGLNIGYD